MPVWRIQDAQMKKIMVSAEWHKKFLISERKKFEC